MNSSSPYQNTLSRYVMYLDFHVFLLFSYNSIFIYIGHFLVAYLYAGIYPTSHMKSCCAFPAVYLRPVCSKHLRKMYMDNFFIRPGISNYSTAYAQKISVELCASRPLFQRCVKSETFFLLLALHSDNLVAKLTHLQLGPLR